MSILCVHLWRCLGHLCRCRGAAKRWRSGGAAWTDSHSGRPAPGEDRAGAVNGKKKKNEELTENSWTRNDVESLHLVCKITQGQNTAPVLSICRPDSMWGVFYVLCFLLLCNIVIIMLIWNSQQMRIRCQSGGNRRTPLWVMRWPWPWRVSDHWTNSEPMRDCFCFSHCQQ